MELAAMAAQQAPQEAAEPFVKPDVSSTVPPELKDAVDRIVAAGMKLMYAPQTRAQLEKAVQSQEPVPKVLAENITGLILMLDSKTKGGLPPEPLFPAAVTLLGDAAEVLSEAGRPVTKDDYENGVRMLYVMLSKKLGASDAQIMDAANKALPADQQVAGGTPPDGPATDAPPAGMPAPAAEGGQQLPPVETLPDEGVQP